MENNYPLVSVLIPVYNVAEYIDEAIRSIINQTYANIEIIIIDDCSTDKTFDICMEYSLTHDNIRLLRNDVNQKICRSLNRGLGVCRGDYILRMDGDDIASLNRIEFLYDYMLSNQLDLVSSYTVSMYSDGYIIGYNSFPVTPDECKLLMPYASICSHNWLCKKEVYTKLNGYRDLPSVEDYDFLQRAILSGFQVGNAPFYGIKVRVRNNNTLSVYGLKQRILFNYAKDINLKKGGFLNAVSEQDRDEFYRRYAWFERVHRVSDAFLMYYIERKNRNKFLSYFSLFLSCVISPFQFNKVMYRYVYNRKLNKMSKKHSNIASFI
ncbi:hypothetical protein KAM344_40230 [Aeromonas caviae]|uniref:glycosyltransferase family 2 protein n=1 Tax=Aeromonas caviae TaxID=648 RepID=UPI001FC8CB49|nr:glycosyltransferase family 2 protein [Aeromonas caviae]GKQ68858.1 hypothetical protein KAM344_40230 [Aeromonas caviae]